MKTVNPAPSPHSGDPLDPRVIALARALGRYQALRDMAAAGAAAAPDEGEVEDADDVAWPTASSRPRAIDHYCLQAPPGFLPGFIAYASVASSGPAAFLCR